MQESGASSTGPGSCAPVCEWWTTACLAGGKAELLPVLLPSKLQIREHPAQCQKCVYIIVAHAQTHLDCSHRQQQTHVCSARGYGPRSESNETWGTLGDVRHELHGFCNIQGFWQCCNMQVQGHSVSQVTMTGTFKCSQPNP